MNAKVSINAQTQSFILMGGGNEAKQAVLYKPECLP